MTTSLSIDVLPIDTEISGGIISSQNTNRNNVLQHLQSCMQKNICLKTIFWG